LAPIVRAGEEVHVNRNEYGFSTRHAEAEHEEVKVEIIATGVPEQPELES